MRFRKLTYRFTQEQVDGLAINARVEFVVGTQEMTIDLTGEIRPASKAGEVLRQLLSHGVNYIERIEVAEADVPTALATFDGSLLNVPVELLLRIADAQALSETIPNSD